MKKQQSNLIIALWPSIHSSKAHNVYYRQNILNLFDQAKTHNVCYMKDISDQSASVNLPTWVKVLGEATIFSLFLASVYIAMHVIGGTSYA